MSRNSKVFFSFYYHTIAEGREREIEGGREGERGRERGREEGEGERGREEQR